MNWKNIRFAGLTALSLMVALAAWQPAPAQVIVVSGRGGFDGPNVGTVKLKVVEEKTQAPIPYASVYLTAKNDTLITNFTVTDTLGVAQLKKVTLGTYNVFVELLGYKSYQKEQYFGFSWSKREVDLGTVALAEDTELLDAARITAIGNPIEIKQDTVIFNAASFQLGQNAVLEDLLKRMPGMEVSNDGTIKYNGETIPRITVGGKTFFSDDPKMALKNLPAKVVDKVKVIDKKTDAEEFTGVAENREKVMDLEFKQEFKEGWFGNAEAGLGSTLAGDRAAEMIDDRGLLYAGSVLVSGYTEKDQLTLVGNAGNSPIGGGGVVVFFSEEGASASMGTGLTTQEQAGVNYNTTRLKGLETSASAQFNHGFVDNRRKASRTTFVPGGNDNLSDTETKTFTNDHSLQANLELKNTDRKKLLFTFRPRFTYTRGQREAYNDNRAQESGGEFLNSSSSSTFSLSHEADYSSSVELGFRNLGGNKRRSLTLNGQFSYTDYDADSREYSETQFRGADVAEVKDLFYDTDNRNGRGSLNFTYVEPLSANWALSAQGVGSITWRNNVKDAFGRTSGAAHFDASVVDKGDYRTPNAYYSTSSESRYVFFRELVQLQYQKGFTSVQFGANLQESLNEMTSVSRGITTQSGIGEWIIDWNPYLQLRWRKGQQANFFIFYNGNTLQPSVTNMLPRLNLSVPTRLSLGNIYLQPSFRHNASFSINANNAAAQRSLSLSFSGGMTLRSSVSASWFDADGVHYSIPVNAAKPALNASVFSFFNTPLTADKRLTTTINLMTMYTRSVSFQNVRRLDPLDIDAFDYNAFMAGFWGSDERGETFYSGASGFSESLTHALRLAPSMSLRYRGDQVTASAGASTSMHSSRYSLDSDADTRTWTSTVSGSFDWTTKHGFELNTSARYYFFAGFPQGYNEPYLNWDFSLTKNIKAWALRFSIYDILNQSRSTGHVVTANYVEDSMHNQTGRSFIFSVKWNFGKLNAAKSRNAEGLRRDLDRMNSNYLLR